MSGSIICWSGWDGRSLRKPGSTRWKSARRISESGSGFPEGKALTLDMVNKMPPSWAKSFRTAIWKSRKPRRSPPPMGNPTSLADSEQNGEPVARTRSRIAMTRYLKRLQGLRWKHGLHLLIRVFSDFRNAGLLALLLFVAWEFGRETVLIRPASYWGAGRGDPDAKKGDGGKKKPAKAL